MMKGVGLMLRRVAGGRASSVGGRSLSISENIILSSAAVASCSSPILAEDGIFRPLIFLSTAPAGFQGVFLNHSRSFSSSPSSDPSKVVLIESEEQFNDSLRQVQDESLPAIFYFTAVWCPPCRLLSSIIGQLSEVCPHVTTYKIDIDKEELGNALSRLNINSVPTLHFFQCGKKVSEVIGADLQLVKDTMEAQALYK